MPRRSTGRRHPNRFSPRRFASQLWDATLALTVQGILKTLLVGLTLTTAYTFVVLMTIYWPSTCRRSSATWTLSTTMAALVLWLVAPDSWRVLPHPIYLAWIVSVVTFGLVAVFDKRRIEAPEGIETRP